MQRDYLHQLPPQGGLAGHTGLARRLHVDVPLLLLLLAVSVYGLIVLYSASDGSMAEIRRQGTFFLLAYGIMMVVAQVRVDLVRDAAPWLYVVGVGLLILVPVLGSDAKGAQRWLDLPGLPRFQPSEMMKLVVPLTLAWYLSSRLLPPRFKYVLVSTVLIVVPVGFIVKQPDLGTALLIGASGVFVLLLAGLSWRYVIGASGAFLLAAPLIWVYGLHEYQKRRIRTLFDPDSDKLGAGWNIAQSKTAIGSGGWDGKGWMEGTQSHLDFLPESHTDFIIAVLAEEFGLAGVLILLALYFLIVCRGLMIALNAQDMFSRLVAGSITLTFFVYVFVNMGMVTGLLPVVGVPLPLVSHGGTAIVTLMAGFGLLMGIATAQRRLIAL